MFYISYFIHLIFNSYLFTVCIVNSCHSEFLVCANLLKLIMILKCRGENVRLILASSDFTQKKEKCL